MSRPFPQDAAIYVRDGNKPYLIHEVARYISGLGSYLTKCSIYLAKGPTVIVADPPPGIASITNCIQCLSGVR
jgi:hypothetical protein